MSKSLSYMYTGTKGYIINIASNLPQTGSDLTNIGWIDISHPSQANMGSFTYKDPTTGLKIRYDTPTPGENGFKGKNHFHILNPNATNARNMYLDIHGNPVAKNCKASHILPKERD